MLLPVVAALALPGREVANDLAMNPCSGMNCALPCDQDYCHSAFEHGGNAWEGDKCFLDRCMGCEPCKSTTPPRASRLCSEKDTWAPKFQPNNPRRACDTWASKIGSALKDTCNADTVDGHWAQEHCPFTCCLVTKGIAPLLHPEPSPSPSATTSFSSAQRATAGSTATTDTATATTETATETSPATTAEITEVTTETTETTIAIGFLTRGDLPLFSKVWGAFFSGCHGHAAVPIVHSQVVRSK